MPLQKKTVYVPFGDMGLDTGSADPKVTQEGHLLLDNAVFTRKAAITKRKGTAIAAAGSSTDVFMSSYEDRPVQYGERMRVWDGATFDTGSFYDVSTGITDFRGTRPSFLDAETSVITNLLSAKHIRNPDVAQKDDIIAVCYTVDDFTSESYGPFQLDLIVYDKNTKAPIASSKAIKTGSNEMMGRFVDSGVSGKLFFFYTDTNGAFFGLIIDTTTGVISSSTTLTGLKNADTNFGVQRFFDVASFDEAGNAVCIVSEETTTPGIQIGSVDTTASTITTGITTSLTYTGPLAFGCFTYITNEVLVVWHDTATSTARMAGFSSNLTLRVADTVLRTGLTNKFGTMTGIATSGTEARIYWEERDTTTVPPPRVIIKATHVSTDAATVDVLAEPVAYGTYLFCKPFVDSNNNVHLGLYGEDTQIAITDVPTNPRIYFMRDDAPHGSQYDPGRNRVVAKTLQARAAYTYGDVTPKVIGKGGLQAETHQHISSSISTGTDTWSIGVAQRLNESTDFDFVSAVSSIDLSYSTFNKAHEANSLLHIPNGNPYLFDGQEVVESGFLVSPNQIYHMVQGAGGTLNIGDYSYAVVYEWYDAKGNRHQSAPSDTITASVSADGVSKVQLTIPYLNLSRRSNVNIVIYRSVVNQPVLYRLTSIANDQDTDTIVVEDTGGFGSEATLASQEIIYSQSELPNGDVPNHRIQTIFQSRQVVVPRDFEESLIQYSKTFIPEIAPEHSTIFRLDVTPEGGRIVALGVLNDKLIIFKRRQIWATHGVGFDRNGNGQNFAEPYLVSESIGCKLQKSVVLTPDGLMFESDAGIYLLTKGLEIVPIGRPAKFLTDTLTIVAANTIPDLNHVIFSTSGASAIVYNYLYRKWSTFNSVYTAVDAVQSFGGILYWRPAAGADIYVEDSSTETDNDGITDNYIPLSVETPWLSFAGVGGFSRVYEAVMVMYKVDDHQLNIKTAYDFDPQWEDEQVYLGSNILNFDFEDYYGAGLAATYKDQAYLIQLNNSRQKCTAIRFSLIDSAAPKAVAVATGEGYSLIGMAFVVADKGEIFRQGARRNVSL